MGDRNAGVSRETIGSRLLPHTAQAAQTHPPRQDGPKDAPCLYRRAAVPFLSYAYADGHAELSVGPMDSLGPFHPARCLSFPWQR